MSIIIKGHVEAILRDRDGNIIAREEGKTPLLKCPTTSWIYFTLVLVSYKWCECRCSPYRSYD